MPFADRYAYLIMPAALTIFVWAAVKLLSLGKQAVETRLAPRPTSHNSGPIRTVCASRSVR